MMKKTLTALALCSAIALTGCVSNESKTETPEQTVAVYEEFANNPPSFDVQLIGRPDIDVMTDGVARFAKAQHEAMKTLLEMNPQGRQLKETLVAAAQAQNVPYDRAFIEGANLSDTDKALLKTYEAEVARLAAQQTKQWAGAAETAIGLAAIIKQKDAVLKGMSFTQALTAGKNLMKAGTQANYALKCYDYFKQTQAAYENAIQSQGQR